MRPVIPLRALIRPRSFHSCRIIRNADSPAPVQPDQSQGELPSGISVTESGKKDIEGIGSSRPSQAQTQKQSPSKRSAGLAGADDITLDLLSKDASSATTPSATSKRSQARPGAESRAARTNSGQANNDRRRPTNRSPRDQNAPRGPRGDRQPRRSDSSGSGSSANAAGRPPRPGRNQRYESRQSAMASGANTSTLDEVDARSRGKQPVQPVELKQSFGALFGEGSVVTRAVKKDGKPESSLWAVEKGLKADEARREDILRLAGSYYTQTPSSARPSTLPARATAAEKAKATAIWTMGMNPSMDLAEQAKARKVLDVLIK